jgi:putative hydrolase of the HAD superfamily
MIKAVLFDADGVLLSGKMFSQQYLEDFGVKIPDSFFETEFEDALIGEKDLKELLKTKIKEWKWGKSVDELVQYWLNTTQDLDQQLVKLVKQLKTQGLRCYVVTNQEKIRADHMLQQLGFKELFDGFFASAHVGYKKPQLEFFLHVLQKINCQGEEVVYFDDSPGYLDGAKSLGINAYLYTSVTELKTVLKKHQIL